MVRGPEPMRRRSLLFSLKANAMMSPFLLRATALVLSRVTFVEGLPTSRRVISPSISQATGQAARFTALGSSNIMSETGHSLSTEPPKAKKMSRKQRRRKSEDINRQRIDKILAHRGVGTRSQTFELAKAKRIRYATRADAPHEERIRVLGPKEKVSCDVVRHRFV